jgi:hypothetical protein
VGYLSGVVFFGGVGGVGGGFVGFVVAAIAGSYQLSARSKSF